MRFPKRSRSIVEAVRLETAMVDGSLNGEETFVHRIAMKFDLGISGAGQESEAVDPDFFEAQHAEAEDSRICLMEFDVTEEMVLRG